MSSRSFICICLASVLSVLGCSARAPKTSPPAAVVAPQSTAASVGSHTPVPVPAGLPTFGTPTSTTIRVLVFGMFACVNEPGYYYLPQGAAVRDAVEAAKGLGFLATWRTYSGIERPQPDGSFEVIRFTRNRSAEEQITLRDGDRIYFGHEIY